MASSRFVLPDPFAPTRALTPGCRSTAACGWLRKSATSKRRRCTGVACLPGQADWHQQVQKAAPVVAVDERRLEAVADFQDHLGVAHPGDTVAQVGGVERHRERLALVLGLDRGGPAADVLQAAVDLDAVAP